jgi:hypothetical protein
VRETKLFEIPEYTWDLLAPAIPTATPLAK